jgi:hypothetical protein
MERYSILDLETGQRVYLFASSPEEALSVSSISPSAGAVQARRWVEGKGFEWIVLTPTTRHNVGKPHPIRNTTRESGGGL